jgi:nicotinamidase-related amidase
MIEFQGRQIPESLEETVKPEHTVVMVQDSQNDFLHKDGLFRKQGIAQDASRLFEPMANFLNEARAKKVWVLYSVFTNYADYSNLNDPQIRRGYPNSLDSSKHPVVEDTWGWQIVDEVKPQKGERIIRKNRNDTFIGTNLELILRSSGIKTIIHIGISIPNGILTSAWHAFNIGFFPVIPQDAAGAAIQSDEAEGWKLLRRCATITTTKEILEAWE